MKQPKPKLKWSWLIDEHKAIRLKMIKYYIYWEGSRRKGEHYSSRPELTADTKNELMIKVLEWKANDGE